MAYISAGELSSLDLTNTLRSGYYAQSRLSRTHGRAPRLSPSYYLSGLGWLREFRTYVDVTEDRQVVRSFPYMDDNQRLGIWDVEEKKPIRVTGRGVIDGGLTGEQVQKRWPSLFSWAQRLGYWGGVKV